MLFPTHEQVYLFAQHRELLAPLTGLALPEFDAVRRLQSKAEFARLMDELSLPTPETVIVQGESEAERAARYPCYVKLAHGTAGYGVQLVHNLNELQEALRQFRSDRVWRESGELVIQQPAVGRQGVVNAVFQQGRLVAAHCTDVLHTGIGGGPTLRVGAARPVVVDQLRRLGTSLGWHGPLFLDYFYDAAADQPQYIEANPRIGETVNAWLSGLNLCELVVRISLGERVDGVEPSRDGVASHTGFIILLSDAFAGASRWELVRRMASMWTGKSPFDVSQSEMTRLREDWQSFLPAAATCARMLAFPRTARRLSKGTVDHYSLPQPVVAAMGGQAGSPAATQQTSPEN